MSRPRVVITQPPFEETVRALSRVFDVDANCEENPWSATVLEQKLHHADGVLAFMPDRFGRELLSSCPKLKIVAAALKGYDNFDVDAFREFGVALTIVRDSLTVPTAELVVGLMIAVARNVLAGDRLVRSGTFEGWRPRLYGTGLHGSTVGLLGFGEIGKAIYRRLLPFGCVMQYHDPVDSAERVPNVSLERLLATSDYLVLCAPLNADTEAVIDATSIKTMKPTCFVINPARGSLVDECDVAVALEAGDLAGYAADVFAFEDWANANRPLEIASELLHSDKTVFTPHLGSAVARSRQLIEREAAAALLDFFAGKEPEGIVVRAASP